MSEILSIEELKKMSTSVIEIPNFDNTGKIKVRVKKPKLLQLAGKGEIPNHLLSSVNSMVTGGNTSSKRGKNVDIKNMAELLELICEVSLVEPTYKEFKEIITDEQMFAIFDWGMGDIEELDNFRENEEDGSSNNNG